jgi:pimeloyl-ACP methyl ester carboxylesterase
VFVHGALCNGDLWRDVVPRLADRHRCIVPDLPLGSHARPAPAGADMRPPALAALIGEFLAALDLTDVTLVANDYGGALTQLLLARGEQRIARVLLTSCDSFGQLPPRYLKPATLAMRAGLGPAVVRLGRREAVKRLFWRSVAHRRLEPEIWDSYMAGIDRPEIAADILRLGRALRPRYTLAAARRLGAFTGPAIVAWAADDPWFARRNGRRLARRFPHGRFELVENARTFLPEDAPGRVAELVDELTAAPASGTARIADAPRAAGERWAA